LPRELHKTLPRELSKLSSLYSTTWHSVISYSYLVLEIGGKWAIHTNTSLDLTYSVEAINKFFKPSEQILWASELKL